MLSFCYNNNNNIYSSRKCNQRDETITMKRHRITIIYKTNFKSYKKLEEYQIQLVKKFKHTDELLIIRFWRDTYIHTYSYSLSRSLFLSLERIFAWFSSFSNNINTVSDHFHSPLILFYFFSIYARAFLLLLLLLNYS